MVIDAAGIVPHRSLSGGWQCRILNDEVSQRHGMEVGQRGQRSIQVIHIGFQMAVVMDANRFRVNGHRQRVVAIGKRLQRKRIVTLGHGGTPSFLDSWLV